MSSEHAIVAEGICPDSSPWPPLSCRLGDEPLVCIMGPRVCRHSYMRLLAGVDPSGKGALYLLGWASEALDRETSRWLRQRIGYIAPYLRLLSVISGWRNVMLAANYHDIEDTATREQRARALIEALPGAPDPHALPAYMNQFHHMHLAAARALMLLPAFFFAEDPFRGLERDERARLGSYLARTATQYSNAVVVSTDDAGFARDYADRILFVSPEGYFEFEGWPALRASNVSVVQNYFGWRSPGSSAPEEEP